MQKRILEDVLKSKGEIIMTNLQIILSIIGSSLAILGSVIGFITWLMKRIMKAIEKKMTEKVNEIGNKVDKIHNQLDEQEKWRLRDNILMFAQILRNTPDIENVSENIFNNIFQDYDKYKKLGGNSFVDSEMEYINKMHKQKDNFNTNVNHKKK